MRTQYYRAPASRNAARRAPAGVVGSLRGQIGAGPNRMNRAVARAGTSTLAGWLLGSAGHYGEANDVGGSDLRVVIGWAARQQAAEFAYGTPATWGQPRR